MSASDAAKNRDIAVDARRGVELNGLREPEMIVDQKPAGKHGERRHSGQPSVAPVTVSIERPPPSVSAPASTTLFVGNPPLMASEPGRTSGVAEPIASVLAPHRPCRS